MSRVSLKNMIRLNQEFFKGTKFNGRVLLMGLIKRCRLEDGLPACLGDRALQGELSELLLMMPIADNEFNLGNPLGIF